MGLLDRLAAEGQPPLAEAVSTAAASTTATVASAGIAQQMKQQIATFAQRPKELLTALKDYWHCTRTGVPMKPESMRILANYQFGYISGMMLASGGIGFTGGILLGDNNASVLRHTVNATTLVLLSFILDGIITYETTLKGTYATPHLQFLIAAASLAGYSIGARFGGTLRDFLRSMFCSKKQKTEKKSIQRPA